MMPNLLRIMLALALLTVGARTAGAQPGSSLSWIPATQTLQDVTGVSVAIGVQTENIPALKGRVSVDDLKASAVAKLHNVGLTMLPAATPISALIIEVDVVDSGRGVYAMSVIASYSRYVWVPESTKEAVPPKRWTTAVIWQTSFILAANDAGVVSSIREHVDQCVSDFIKVYQEQKRR